MIFTAETFLFSLFSLFSLVSASLVITLNNAVQSVLFLVLTFFNVACLLLLLGAEFFAFLLIIVYVGAIAVLFLFVIMMLNLKIKLKFHGNYLGVVVPLIGFVIWLLQFNFNPLLDQTDLLRLCRFNPDILWNSWLHEREIKENVVVIGHVLYSTYGLVFLLASLILLVAMIGAIVLTMHYKLSSRAQSINLQGIRTPKDAVKFITIRK